MNVPSRRRCSGPDALIGPVDGGVDREVPDGLVEAGSVEVVGGVGEPRIGFAVFAGV